MKTTFLSIVCLLTLGLAPLSCLAGSSGSAQNEARALLQLVQLAGQIQKQRLVQEATPVSVRERVRQQLIRDIQLSD